MMDSRTTRVFSPFSVALFLLPLSILWFFFLCVVSFPFPILPVIPILSHYSLWFVSFPLLFNFLLSGRTSNAKYMVQNGNWNLVGISWLLSLTVFSWIKAFQCGSYFWNMGFCKHWLAKQKDYVQLSHSAPTIKSPWQHISAVEPGWIISFHWGRCPFLSGNRFSFWEVTFSR